MTKPICSTQIGALFRSIIVIPKLSDTTKEIKTFTRKETNQYRLLSMPENAPMLEQSSGKFENSSKVNFIVI
jgi:hypothetical protein